MTKKILDRKVQNPSIPRSHLNMRTQVNFNGYQKQSKTSRINKAEEESDSEDEQVQPFPGPGQYLKPYHNNLIGTRSIVHNHPQNFGTTMTRFKTNTKMLSTVGPG